MLSRSGPVIPACGPRRIWVLLKLLAEHRLSARELALKD